MGKIRVKTLGIEEEEKQQQKEQKKRKEAKKLEKKAVVEPVVEENVAAGEEKVVEQTKVAKPAKKEKFAKASKKRIRSKAYQLRAEMLDKSRLYSLKDALSLLEKMKNSKFDETVELHINTNEQGINGTLTLPHGTGKKTRVAIADEKIIADVEKGIINFDILVAAPQMMPKLAKVARILGPKGLMPNPKNGTITAKPEDIAKKYEGGQMQFKTEAKAPIIHLTVGKLSFGDKKLQENIDTAVSAIKKSNIKNATLKSTMSPGIKISVA